MPPNTGKTIRLLRDRPRRLPSFIPHAALLLGLILLSGTAVRAVEPLLKLVYQGKTVSIWQAEFSALHHQEATAYDSHEKENHVYSGVPVHDLLAKAGVPLGEKLRGKSLGLAVLVRCRDHYDIVFALAEFDPAFNPRTILLVDRQDGQPLPDAQGPLRLLVPGDQRPARWARMVTSLEVLPVGGP